MKSPHPSWSVAPLDGRPPQETRDLAPTEELAAVHTAIAEGSGGIVWVGEPGSGRTRLLAALTEALIAEGLTVVGLASILEVGQDGRQGGRQGGAARDVGTSALPGLIAVGDLDSLDGAERDRVIERASHPANRIVLLASSRVAPQSPQGARAIAERAMRGLSAVAVLRYLSDVHDMVIAPVVASSFSTALQGNPGTIIEVARMLSREQLLGRSALPDPLPATPLMAELLADDVATLTELERRALLIASVAVVDRVELLCTAAEIGLDEMIRGALARYIELVAGRFEVIDERVRSYVHQVASMGERTDAHARLARAHDSVGDRDIAEWHCSLAHQAGRPQATARLIALARRSLHRGDSVWAYSVARQAAAQAEGRPRRTAEYLAGLTALESGFTTDALDWLGRCLRSGRPSEAARASAAFIAAATFSRGEVPDVDVRRLLADREERTRLGRAVTDGALRAAAVAAALHAERGQGEAVDELMTAARAAAGRDPRMLRALDEAKAWCSGFGGSPAAPSGEVGVLTASGPYTVVARAIDLARRREWSRATELIDEVLLARSPGGSAVPFASEEPTTTPLAEAHLRVVRALVDIAVGRLAKAAADLERAAMTLPVGIPFAGLGLAALNRLSIIVRHTSSPLYPSLVMVGGVATDEIVRRESLVDDALMASLDGDHERAAVLMRVVNDHLEGAAARSFDLPTPDEAQLWLAAGEQESATRCLQSARSDRAVSTTPAIWRGRLALAASGEIEALSAEVAPLTSTMDSLYERARTELELSVALDRAGDDRSRLHLAAARHLFARAGAAPPGGEAGAALGLSGPLALHRDSNVGSHREAAPWMTQLTSREVDVALGVVEGRSNRDVARALHLSVRTVETHLGRVFAKLDVHSRTQLAHLAHLTSDLENPA